MEGIIGLIDGIPVDIWIIAGIGYLMYKLKK